MAETMEDWEKIAERVSANMQAAQIALPRSAPLSMATLFERAPAWITLFMGVVVGYTSLNGRVSACEYQNQTGIADRADLRRRVDKTGETLAELKIDLGEIKVTLKEMAERK